MFSAEGVVADGHITACQFGAPRLWLWDGRRQLELKDISRHYPAGSLPQDELAAYRSLAEVTGLSLDEFASSFSDPAGDGCLEMASWNWR
jgi:hypothetical protein